MIGASIRLDSNDCISSIGNAKVSGLRGLRNRLNFLHTRPDTYNVGFMFTASSFDSACMNSGSHFCDVDLSVTIDQTQVRDRLDAPAYWGCSVWGLFQTQPSGFGWGNPVAHSGETIIAHELLGHAWAHAVKLDSGSEHLARDAENSYRTGRGGRARCNP